MSLNDTNVPFNRSRHVLAITLAYGAFMWAYYTLIHHAPFYAATVMHIPVPTVSSSSVFIKSWLIIFLSNLILKRSH